MKLTDSTYDATMETLRNAYSDWKITDKQLALWYEILKSSIADEVLPIVILDWIKHKTESPRNPAEILKYAVEMVNKRNDSSDTASNILMEAGRKAYQFSSEYQSFADTYTDSFASILEPDPQTAYVKENIREHSSSPNVLIFIFDEYKGAIKDVFTGGAENGLDFLRTNIKKKWNSEIQKDAEGKIRTGDNIKKILMSQKNTDKQLEKPQK